MLLYPELDANRYDNGTSHTHAQGVSPNVVVADLYSVQGAMFTSLTMLFSGSEVQLINEAHSPRLAMWHYIYYVVLTPLIMLNLLIALMVRKFYHLFIYLSPIVLGRFYLLPCYLNNILT
eukprot:COSAG01_NODE_48986_length_376_cov_0.740072_1_plen_120_part_10